MPCNDDDDDTGSDAYLPLRVVAATDTQVFRTVSNLQAVDLPLVVLPLSDAATGAVIPQSNRYAPVCQPGTYAGPDEFLPCIPCPAGSFQVRQREGIG